MSEPNVSVPAADIRSYTDEEPIGEEALVNFFSNNCRFSAERANEFAHAFFNLNTDKSFLKQLLHGLQESKANGDIYLQKIVPKATLTEVIRLIIALNSLFSIPISNISAVTEKEQEFLQRLSKYVYVVDGMVACATAVSVDILATCYHCLSSSIRSGPGIEEEKAHREAVVHLTNSSTGEKVQARIAIYSVENDVALLQTLNDAKLMDGKEIVLDDAYVGQPYYILGTPISDDEAPLQVISGRISAKFIRTLTKQTIHDLHGHGGARVGASGGAAFARHLDYGKAHFLGIVVSGPSISHDTKIGTFVSSNYVKMISSGTLYAIYMLFKNRDNVFKF